MASVPSNLLCEVLHEVTNNLDSFSCDQGVSEKELKSMSEALSEEIGSKHSVIASVKMSHDDLVEWARLITEAVVTARKTMKEFGSFADGMTRIFKNATKNTSGGQGQNLN